MVKSTKMGEKLFNHSNRVAIVVLGDVGRSPRMQYHALSILSKGGKLSIVGYSGEEFVPTLNAQLNEVDLILFDPFEWPMLKAKCWPLFAIIKAVILVLQLLCALFRMKRPDCIIVQNPPAIPTLPVVLLFGLLRGVNVIVDWHNLGFTMIALALGPLYKNSLKYYIVAIFRMIEIKCAQMAHGHMCVTHAMKEYLEGNFSINAVPLHDTPPSFFGQTSNSVEKKHDLFMRLKKEFEPAEKLFGAQLDETTSLFTRCASEKVTLLPNRPALLVSPTSWTEDEDFSILLEALLVIDNKPETANLVVVVTGKGPLKDFYIAKIKSLNLTKVAVLTMWLSPADYPILLGCADLGICLHTSTSGLDLPMKVVDMFGSGVPVCAIHFKCIAELVHHGKNGLVFKDKSELAQQLGDLFYKFPVKPEGERPNKLQELKNGVRATVRWEENWSNVAYPEVSRVLGLRQTADMGLLLLFSLMGCLLGWVIF